MMTVSEEVVAMTNDTHTHQHDDTHTQQKGNNGCCGGGFGDRTFHRFWRTADERVKGYL